jgi:hypothetical protein
LHGFSFESAEWEAWCVKSRRHSPATNSRSLFAFFAQRDISCVGEGFRQSDLASLEHILGFDFGDLSTLHNVKGESKFVPRVHFVGSQTAASGYAHYKGRHLGFGIFLKPLASWQLFRVPPSVVANEDGDGRDLLGKGLDILWHRLAEKNTFHERILIAEEFYCPLQTKRCPGP